MFSRSWLRRSVLPDDVWWWNGWDWEVVNKWIELRAVTHVNIIRASDQQVRSLARLVAQRRRHTQECVVSSVDSLCSGTSLMEFVAFLLWKKRRTEDSFQMGFISHVTANQKCEMYRILYSKCCASINVNASMGCDQIRW